MKVTALLGLVLAVTGALAAPGGKAPPKPPPKPAPPSNNQQNTLQCNSGAPYCCTSSSGGTNGDGSGGSKPGGGGDTEFKCSKLTNQCNSIMVCCTNNAQQGTAKQNCAAFGSAKVIFDD